VSSASNASGSTITSRAPATLGMRPPHQVWYKPLTTIQNAIVGKSEVYRYKDTHLPVTWQQSGTENNVFVGNFSM
jgi:hypothetical protein